MENNNEKETAKTTDNEEYNSENPQNQNLPKYNSTTTDREGKNLPGVENLNHIDGLNNELKATNNEDSDPLAPKNDASLYGEKTKTDLGNGQPDDDEKEDEKIIRT